LSRSDRRAGLGLIILGTIFPGRTVSIALGELASS
jgi:hypothetical protein